MTRASIASLVLTPEGLELLWIHIVLLFWLTFSWILTLFYISNGAFKLRALQIASFARRAEHEEAREKEAQYHPHPHPQFPFQDVPSLDEADRSNRGLRLRTVMVSNVPVQLRSEKELKEYFEYYMSRPIDKPSVGGLTSSTQPGLVNKFLAFGFNRAKRLPQHLPLPTSISIIPHGATEQNLGGGNGNGTPSEEPRVNPEDVPVIERVVIARKMTELASLLERREDILRSLEVAHIRLAKKTLLAVSKEMERRREMGGDHSSSRDDAPPKDKDDKKRDTDSDLESGLRSPLNNASSMDLLIRTLAPFVKEFDVAAQTTSSTRKAVNKSKHALWHRRIPSPRESGHDLTALTKISSSETGSTSNPADSNTHTHTSHPPTIWDALLSLPRAALDPYQPLIHLSVLFRGKTVPSIDYYTAKLLLLTSLITQNRAQPPTDYDAVSTAFVTFKDPRDARRAAKWLAVHPGKLVACEVGMAPGYEDVDWGRVMKSRFRAEVGTRAGSYGNVLMFGLLVA